MVVQTAVSPKLAQCQCLALRVGDASLLERLLVQARLSSLTHWDT